MLLGFDTSTAWAGVCLYDAERRAIVHEWMWYSGTRHNEQLLPTVDAALKWHGLAIDAISAVGVAIGPGTFNGVRVAVATAKLLARARGLPLVGVDTLEVYAAQAQGSGLLVRPLLGAARAEAATALWRAGAQLERLEPDRIAAPDELFRPPGEPTLFTGELTDEWRAAIETLGPNALIATPAQAARRPSALLQLAVARLESGQPDDASTLQALYLRPPHITQTRR